MPETAIRERSIIFSGGAVCAILAGAKTQTRRIIKPQPPEWCTEFGYTAFTPPGSISGRGYWKGVPGEEGPGEKFFRCPYGLRGQRLWVRETWSPWADEETRLSVRGTEPANYRADYTPGVKSLDIGGDYNWHSPIYMPRSASRITLEIISVRVERIQDITAHDCYAEGVRTMPSCQCEAFMPGFDIIERGGNADDRYRRVFARCWDEVSAKRGYGWASNLWVWALTFKVLEPAP